MAVRLFLVALMACAAVSSTTTTHYFASAAGLNAVASSSSSESIANANTDNDDAQLSPPQRRTRNSDLNGGGAETKMYMVSDLHYDAYFGTATAVGDCTSQDPSQTPIYGRATCDGSKALITNALNDVFSKSKQDSNSIFLLLGDVLRHEIDKFANTSAPATDYLAQFKVPLAIAANSTNFVAKLISERFSDISTVIPHPNLLGALGNNDCVPHYFMEKMRYATAVVDFTEVFLRNGLVTQAEQDEWQVCGYYSRLVSSYNGAQTGPALILNINSVFYSEKSNMNNAGRDGDPCGQFAWMQQQMQVAREKGYKVIIIGHVVPMVTKWMDSYIATYTQLLKKNSDVVTAQFFSHTHMFTFVALSTDDSIAPIFDVPSISPIDGNNPSYAAVSFDANWHVSEIYHRYMNPNPSAGWVDGEVFGKSFNLPSPLTNSNLVKFAKNLLSVSKKSDEWKKFLALYEGGFISSTMDVGNTKKAKILCLMFCTTTAAYENCVAAEATR